MLSLPSKNTKIETEVNHQIQVFGLNRLHAKNPDQFYSLCNDLPCYVNTNNIKNLDTVFANKKVEAFLQKAHDEIVTEGHQLIQKISNPDIMDYNLSLIRSFENNGDEETICSFFQCLKSEGKDQWFITYKTFLTQDRYLNISYTLDQHSGFGKMLRNILNETFITNNGWQKFQSLTKREKQILKMIATGYSRKDISDQLFISSNTVRTHRQKIMKKIDAKSLYDIIRFTQAFEMTGQL